MNKLKRIIVEIDGKETEYSSLSECAKALGVSAAAVSECASSGWLCKGHVVRYADGTTHHVKKEKTTTRTRHTDKKSTATPQVEAKPQVAATPKATAEDVNKLIAEWYTKEWMEYVSSDALVSLIQYIKDNWQNMINAKPRIH